MLLIRTPEIGLWHEAEGPFVVMVNNRLVPDINRGEDRLVEASSSLHASRRTRFSEVISPWSRPEDMPFQGWAANRRQLPRLLDEMDVKIVSHGIVGSESRDLVEEMKRALLETGRRSEKGAEADAHSAVMVANWREERGPDTSFFIAAERFTGQVFKKLVDPDHALVVSPQAWLIYVSNLGTDSPDVAADLAELIADAMVRNTMLELACAYTFEEVLALSEVLMEAGTITPQDALELGAPQLF